MVALQKGQIERVPIAEAIGSLKMVDPDLLRLNTMFQPRLPDDEHPGMPEGHRDRLGRAEQELLHADG
jgi:6-phosphofructokinase 1